MRTAAKLGPGVKMADWPADKVELWPVDRLRPYERNPRTHSEEQVAQIAASIVEFGFTNPILVDEASGIIAGHGRLLAARQLGLAEVPVMRLEHLDRGAEAGLRHRRQPARRERRLGRGAAAASSSAGSRTMGFDLDLLGFDADRAGAAASLDGCRKPRRPSPRTRSPSRPATRSPGRATSGSGRAPAAVRRRHRAGRRRAGARRRAGRHGLHRPALQRRLRQHGQGQAARQGPHDPERRSRRRLRGVPDRRLHQHARRHQGCDLHLHDVSSELHTLQRAFREAGGKWSTFVIWAKHTFTLGRADYQRQYEPILYGWREGAEHYWCGARDQGDVWFFDKPVARTTCTRP